MTNASVAVLTEEHHDIDTGLEEFIAQIEADEFDASLALRAIEDLRRHIYLEEEFLFPPLREAGLFAPIFVMLREHGEIWQTMEALERALESGADAAALGELCRGLLVQLDRHNAKEEPIIYPHADTDVPAATHAKLQAFVAEGQLPPGWICSGAATA